MKRFHVGAAAFMGFAVLAGVLAVGAVPAGAASSQPQVTVRDDDNGSQIALAQGQSMAVTLTSNPSTGYTWSLCRRTTGKVLRQTGNIEGEYAAPPATDPPTVGAPGTETFHFLAVAPGRTTLYLTYRRPWMKDDPTARTFTVTVVVR